jgi:hypothetical protein
MVWADGVTLVWRKDDVSGAEDVGGEADERGYRFLQERARQKGMTPAAFTQHILRKTLGETGVATLPIDDMTQEEVDKMVIEATGRGEPIEIDITPLSDELEAAPGRAGHKKAR